MAKKIEPDTVINKAFLNARLSISEQQALNKELLDLKKLLSDENNEETNKGYIRDFLLNIGFRREGYTVNPGKKADLLISKNGINYVIIETKKFNTNEMISEDHLNRKALHELILYFMRERVERVNRNLTYLIATDGIDWFFFDAQLFDKLFTKVSSFEKEFKASQINKATLDVSTSDFYGNIAAPYVDSIESQIKYIHVNLLNVFNKDGNVRGAKARILLKLMSPKTLMKQAFTSDSNALDKKFYDDLLYIMGLRDRKDGKGIERLPSSEQQEGALLELVYEAFDSTEFSFENPTQKFDFAVNIVSTWINRILFLKLLEGQLVRFNNDDDSYKFMSFDNINNFNKLNELFFGVLAKPVSKRGKLKDKYAGVPYLNSSLFEKTITEKKFGIKPSDLSDDGYINIRRGSILKSRVSPGTKKLKTLKYLLTLLDSYNFDADGQSVENNSHLINASVLGLIFEKINGYKDGSYYTPGFVTSFMVKKAIDTSLVSKFQSAGWKVNSITDIKENISNGNKKSASQILRDFKIVDPAVGSGHFLVSALNYLLKIRCDLNLLPATLTMNYTIEVENDELLIYNSNENLFFAYRRGSTTSRSIQESLFMTKLDIIEHNLFGVDINQNSVNITRLRLWIELLKSSYYDDHDELKTMPNLEMNIKAGNSVVFKYGLDSNLGDVAAHTDLTVTEFKELVQKYRNTDDKAVKHSLEKDIDKFKEKIVHDILNQKEQTRLRKLHQEVNGLKNSIPLFVEKGDRARNKRKIKRLTQQINLKEQRQEMVNNAALFAESFEWRFEFPEVLNGKGKYDGFDLVVANPPYIGMQGNGDMIKSISKTELGKKFTHGKMDIFYYFMHLALSLINNTGNIAFITTNYWLTATDADRLRSDLQARIHITDLLNFNELKIFDSAQGQHNIITFAQKVSANDQIHTLTTHRKGLANATLFNTIVSKKDDQTSYGLFNENELVDQSTGYFGITSDAHTKMIGKITDKLIKKGINISRYANIFQGITTGRNAIFLWSKKQIEEHDSNLNSMEKQLFKPLVNGSSLKKILEPEKPDKYVMYIDDSVQEEDIPYLVNWIKQHKDYSGQVTRIEKEAANLRPIDIWRPRQKEYFEDTSTIYFQKRTKVPRFTLNDKKYYLKDDSYMIVLKDDYQKKDQYVNVLLTVLNSIVAHFWLVLKGRKKGSSLELYPEVVNTIPFLDIGIIESNDLVNIHELVQKDELINHADYYIKKWFNLTENDILKMEKYISDNQ